MPATIIDTPAGLDSNSYGSVAEALAYFETRLNADDFVNATSDAQIRALIMATRRIEQITTWDYQMIGGSRTNFYQALTFPRIATLNREGDFYEDSSQNPQWLKEAQFEQALVELQSDRDIEPAARGIQRIKADVVEVEFDASLSQVQHPITDSVYTILEPWLISGAVKPNNLYTIDLDRV